MAGPGGEGFPRQERPPFPGVGTGDFPRRGKQEAGGKRTRQDEGILPCGGDGNDGDDPKVTPTGRDPFSHGDKPPRQLPRRGSQGLGKGSFAGAPTADAGNEHGNVHNKPSVSRLTGDRRLTPPLARGRFGSG